MANKGRSIQLGRLSLRRNFSWNFLGTVSYNLAQWLLLVILARVADAQQVGQFSLMLAISAPVFLTVGMNLRVLQVTDASRSWRLSDYLALRHILNLLAILMTCAIGTVMGLRGVDLAALAVISLAKCVEAVSQTYYAYFQQHDRLDLVARDLIARSITGPSLFFVGLIIGGNLFVGAVGLLLGWLVPQLVLDRPNARRLAAQGGLALNGKSMLEWQSIITLARKGLPLGIDQGVSSLAINIPRYAVLGVLGAASLGIYASLAYLAQTVQLITGTLATATINRLSIHYHEGHRRAFSRLLGRLVGFGMIVMTIAILGAATLGEPFLRLTLGDEYANESLLIALMLSAGVITIQRALCKGLEAARRFKTYVMVDVATTAGVAGLSWYSIERWGLEGAAVAMAGGFGVGVIVVGAVLFDVIRKMPRDVESPTGQEIRS